MVRGIRQKKYEDLDRVLVSQWNRSDRASEKNPEEISVFEKPGGFSSFKPKGLL